MIQDAGISITTFQSLVFELIRSKEHPHFKEMLGIVKDHPELSLTNLQFSISSVRETLKKEEIESNGKAVIEEEKKGDPNQNHEMLSSHNPVWGSRAQRKKDNKDKAKEQGKDKFRGGGYGVDKRWTKEE